MHLHSAAPGVNLGLSLTSLSYYVHFTEIPNSGEHCALSIYLADSLSNAKATF